MKGFLIITAICVFLQFALFIPFIFIWEKDCKELGKDNIAVSLQERFFAWCVCCPIWLVPIIIFAKGAMK